MVSYRDMGYRSVFVALDGSDQQNDVLDRAMIVAANNGAALVVGTVVDTSGVESGGQAKEDYIAEKDAAFRAAIADKVAEAQADPDIPSVSVMVEAGPVRETLKDRLIGPVEPDIVLCGARGLSDIKYALLGSVSTFLVRSCACDVLVVKRPPEASAETVEM